MKFKALATAAALVAGTSLSAMEERTVVGVAVGNDNFETLVAAVTAAGLDEVLIGEGPFTVFAPTDDAFAALPEGTVEELLKPENRETLVSILTYHVVPGKITADQIQDGAEIATVQGDTIVLDTDNGVMVDGARVIMADVMASNGVIHAIDKVIMPGS